MSKITYPCETAAICKDVVFVIRPQSRDQLVAECERADMFFREMTPKATNQDLRETRYSFGGLYLNSDDIIREFNS